MATDTKTGGGIEVAVEEREAWKRRLTITVAPERVARARRRELGKLAKSVKLKGFRKGKVPDRVVEERFGPAVDERTVRALIDEAFHQALDVEDLQPVGDPSFGDVQYEPGRSLTFQVELEIMPELRLERLGGFRVRRPAVELSEEEVEAVLERLRGERAVWEPVERPPEVGDLVSVRIARLDEAQGADAEPEARPYRFELGVDYAIPAVEEAIRTLSPGEEGEFTVTFPPDFDDRELADQDRRLRIALLDVKAKRLPPLDDEFAAEVGDFDSVAAVRDAIREDLRRHGEEEAEEAVRRSLLDNILDANPFEVPPAMVERYLERLIEAPEDAEPERVQAARREVRPVAERQLKRQLVLDTLIEREGLEASDQELEARISELAERRGVRPAEARRRLARQRGIDELRRRIAVEKVFDWLASRSTVE